MGKTEKIVVLSILFLVVVLFVWSMGDQGVDASERDGADDSRTGRYSGEVSPGRPAPGKATPPKGTANQPGSSGKPKGPQGGAKERTPDGMLLQRPGSSSGSSKAAENPAGPDQAGGGDRVELEGGPGGPGGPSKLLNAVVDRDSRVDPVVPRRQGGALRTAPAVHMRPGWDIITTDALEPTVNPDMLLHRPAEDATWESLAVDLYGDASKEILLRHNNEGMDAPGDVIFVPAKDDGADEVQGRVVEVLKGETLWQVSKRTLGRGSRWRELFEANRGVISDPDYLAPGTILTVPAQ